MKMGFMFIFSGSRGGENPYIPSVYFAGLNLCSIEWPCLLGPRWLHSPAVLKRRHLKPRYVRPHQGHRKERQDTMTDKTTAVSRRQLLTRIGGLAAAAYTVPAFTTMSMAHASDGSSSPSPNSPASAPSNPSAPSTPSDPSGPSKPSAPSNPSAPSTPSMSSGPSDSSSDANGCAAGTSWDGRTYNASGKVCSPD